MGDLQAIRKKYRVLSPVLSERARRLWAASEASAVGWGGVSLVAGATGLARNTVQAGLKEMVGSPTRGGREASEPRTRRPGGGRKRLADKDPMLPANLEALVEPHTRGDPISPLRWTCLSLSQLVEALGKRGHRVSAPTVGSLLHGLGYSLQANRKTREGSSHPDRDLQFKHINRQTRLFQSRGQPVISVDTKKKELVGKFKNGGREWRPKGKPEEVNVHDFRDDDVSPLGGKAIPYGVYDQTANAGWVSIGVDHDTPDFAVQSIRAWWMQMGIREYPDARELLITADAGGSNGYRTRAWKTALQRFASEARLKITVCHFPPGTSKWNKIEHRMFCHITKNWRGRPLVSHEVIVNLIGNTTTKTGLKIRAKLDKRRYPTGVKVADRELAQVQIAPATFHGEWNYSIAPGS
jgi:transposase